MVHFVFAFFIPLGWAAILYPYSRYYRKDWKKMFIYMVALTCVIVVIKELLDLPERLTLNDIVSDLLGIFLGSAMVMALFLVMNRPFSKKASIFGENVSLSAILAVAKELEERAESFYRNLAKYIPDPDARNICLEVASEEKRHAAVIDSVSSRWLPVAPDPRLRAWVEEKVSRLNMFVFDFPVEDISAKRMLDYAIAQENKTQDIYLSFKRAFPGWKNVYIQMLIDAETSHIAKMKQVAALLDSKKGGAVFSDEGLLELLDKAKKNEDEFVISYGNDFLRDLKASGIVNNDEELEIRNMLTAMLEDTARHGRTIEGIMDKIRAAKT